jgi:hypothetical protein
VREKLDSVLRSFRLIYGSKYRQESVTSVLWSNRTLSIQVCTSSLTIHWPSSCLACLLVSYSMCAAVKARHISSWQLEQGPNLGALMRVMASGYYPRGPALRRSTQWLTSTVVVCCCDDCEVPMITSSDQRISPCFITSGILPPDDGFQCLFEGFHVVPATLSVLVFPAI